MYRIGIDLGGTNVACGVVDENFNIVGRSNLKTNKNGTASEIIDDMAKAAALCVNAAGLKMQDIAFCGIGIPGWVEKDKGYIVETTNLDLSEVNICDIMQEKIGVKCGVENDANAAAYGEFIAGAGKGTKDFIAITLGTGVGSGIIIDRKIQTGVNSSAGEFGHTVIKFDGEPCPCGRRGCYEQYASVTALIRQTKAAMKNAPDSIMWAECDNDIEKVSGRTSFDAMRKGDAAAKQVVDQYIEYIVIGLVDAINIFQPDVICIGGGISKEGKYLIDPISKGVIKYRFSGNCDKQTKIVAALLGNDAGIIGAAYSDGIL